MEESRIVSYFSSRDQQYCLKTRKHHQPPWNGVGHKPEIFRIRKFSIRQYSTLDYFRAFLRSTFSWAGIITCFRTDANKDCILVTRSSWVFLAKIKLVRNLTWINARTSKWKTWDWNALIETSSISNTKFCQTEKVTRMCFIIRYLTVSGYLVRTWWDQDGNSLSGVTGLYRNWAGVKGNLSENMNDAMNCFYWFTGIDIIDNYILLCCASYSVVTRETDSRLNGDSLLLALSPAWFYCQSTLLLNTQKCFYHHCNQM